MKTDILQDATIRYILQCYKANRTRLDHDPKHLFDECKYLIRTLIASLSDEQMKDLANYTHHHADYGGLYWLIDEVRNPKEPKTHYVKPANTPVKQLFKWYTDKSSKKVQVARKELCERFAALDPNIQFSILKLFLEGSIADRIWAYHRYQEHWDKTALNKVVSCWEHAQSWDEWFYSGLLIIRVAPEDLLLSLDDKLYVASDNRPVQILYKEFCLRLNANPNFQIRQCYFNEPASYYYVLSKMGRVPDKESFEHDLYQIVILLYAEEYYRIYPALLQHTLYTPGQRFHYPARIYIAERQYRELHLCEVYDIRRMLTAAISFGFKDIVSDFVVYATKVDADVATIAGTDCVRQECYRRRDRYTPDAENNRAKNKLSFFNERAVPLKTHFPAKYMPELLSYEQSEICQKAKQSVESLKSELPSLELTLDYIRKMVRTDSYAEFMDKIALERDREEIIEQLHDNWFPVYRTEDDELF